MLAQVTARTNTFVCPPAGWTSVDRRNSGTVLMQEIFRKTAVAADVAAANFTFTLDNTAGCGSPLAQQASGGIIAAYGDRQLGSDRRGRGPGERVERHDHRARNHGRRRRRPASASTAPRPARRSRRRRVPRRRSSSSGMSPRPGSPPGGRPPSSPGGIATAAGATGEQDRHGCGRRASTSASSSAGGSTSRRRRRPLWSWPRRTPTRSSTARRSSTVPAATAARSPSTRRRPRRAPASWTCRSRV